MAGFNPVGLSGRAALNQTARRAWAGGPRATDLIGHGLALVTLATPCGSVAGTCEPWQPWPIEAIRSLPSCGQPVSRQIGQLCAQHEWRCGAGSFEEWFDQWMKQQNRPFRVQRQLGQLIFSGEYDDQAWAVFWRIVPSPASGFVILVSRLRAQSR